jgi:hypothetical protein
MAEGLLVVVVGCVIGVTAFRAGRSLVRLSPSRVSRMANVVSVGGFELLAVTVVADGVIVALSLPAVQRDGLVVPVTAAGVAVAFVMLVVGAILAAVGLARSRRRKE